MTRDYRDYIGDIPTSIDETTTTLDTACRHG
jgi:hypothetical protein